MAGWGDDPVLGELRALIYDEGWTPVETTESPEGDTVVVEGPGGDRRRFESDHIAFHRFVEGIHEDFGV